MVVWQILASECLWLYFVTSGCSSGACWWQASQPANTRQWRIPISECLLVATSQPANVWLSPSPNQLLANLRMLHPTSKCLIVRIYRWRTRCGWCFLSQQVLVGSRGSLLAAISQPAGVVWWQIPTSRWNQRMFDGGNCSTSECLLLLLPTSEGCL